MQYVDSQIASDTTLYFQVSYMFRSLCTIIGRYVRKLKMKVTLKLT